MTEKMTETLEKEQEQPVATEATPKVEDYVVGGGADVSAEDKKKIEEAKQGLLGKFKNFITPKPKLTEDKILSLYKSSSFQGGGNSAAFNAGDFSNFAKKYDLGPDATKLGEEIYQLARKAATTDEAKAIQQQINLKKQEFGKIAREKLAAK